MLERGPATRDPFALSRNRTRRGLKAHVLADRRSPPHWRLHLKTPPILTARMVEYMFGSGRLGEVARSPFGANPVARVTSAEVTPPSAARESR